MMTLTMMTMMGDEDDDDNVDEGDDANVCPCGAAQSRVCNIR